MLLDVSVELVLQRLNFISHVNFCFIWDALGAWLFQELSIDVLELGFKSISSLPKICALLSDLREFCLLDLQQFIVIQALPIELIPDLLNLYQKLIIGLLHLLKNL